MDAIADSGAYFVAPNGSDAARGMIETPFATLARAQRAMRGSPIKATYVRAGFYSNSRLRLSQADDGETWRYYPGDGVDSAVLDGGAQGPNSGDDVITVVGGSHITIDGLTIQNYRNWAIGIHGGKADPPGGFSVSSVTADSDTVTNNAIRSGYTTATSGWAGGGVWAQGRVTHLTITNNAVSHQYGSGIRISADGDGVSPDDDISGLCVQNNVVLNTNRATGDNGAIYVQDQTFTSKGLLIRANFIRDYQSEPNLRNRNKPERDVAIYLDRGASNIVVSANIIASSAFALEGSRVLDSTQAFFVGGGGNIEISQNLIDLGLRGRICPMVYEHYYAADPSMHGNRFAQNLIIGNWSGAQDCYVFGLGPYAYPSGTAGGTMEAPALEGNIYFNYGIGPILKSGNAFEDRSPTSKRDPSLSGSEYVLASGSYVLEFATALKDRANLGPPGYAIPAEGSAPSYESHE